MNTLTTSPLSTTNKKSLAKLGKKQSNIEHTLTISTTNTQDYNLEIESVPLSKLCLGIVEVCLGIIEEIESTINIDIPIDFTVRSDNSNIYLDSQFILIQPIVLNLLTNAIKYSQESKAKVDLEVKIKADSITFIVKDRGIGIPVTDQAHIFESFYRGKNTNNIEGSGIGLAVVKRCVDLNQGQISVESILGQGSTFTVCLPYIY